MCTYQCADSRHHKPLLTTLACVSTRSTLVKRYVRKGVPNEHRALVWMSASGAQEQLDRNAGYYQSVLGAQHDPKLVDSIRTGETQLTCLYSCRQISLTCVESTLHKAGIYVAATGTLKKNGFTFWSMTQTHYI